MTKARDELRENIRTVLFKAAGGVTDMANTETGQILSQVDTYVKGIIGEDAKLITPEKYHELYPRRSMKDDAAVHYQNKAIVANNKLRATQRNRAGLEEEKDNERNQIPSLKWPGNSRL